jgi:hypothetical protein
MSVRATERLLGDVVIVTQLPNSPKMVVVDVDIEGKRVTTAWFSDDHAAQEMEFPANCLDRFEAPAKAAPKAKATPGKKSRGRK